MAAAANIVIADGSSANHTFAPARKTGMLVEYEERTTPHTPDGFYTIGISQTAPNSSSPIIKTRITISLPVEVYDSTTATYSYANTSRVNIDVLMPKTLSSGNRADLYAYAKNLLANAVISGLISSLDAPY